LKTKEKISVEQLYRVWKYLYAINKYEYRNLKSSLDRDDRVQFEAIVQRLKHNLHIKISLQYSIEFKVMENEEKYQL
jgi:hypothetical protein